MLGLSRPRGGFESLSNGFVYEDSALKGGQIETDLNSRHAREHILLPRPDSSVIQSNTLFDNVRRNENIPALSPFLCIYSRIKWIHPSCKWQIVTETQHEFLMFTPPAVCASQTTSASVPKCENNLCDIFLKRAPPQIPLPGHPPPPFFPS